MLENLNKYHLVLASNSPRRKELLAGLEIPFEVKTLSGIDESYPEKLKGKEIAMHISQKKAAAYQQFLDDNALIITADTIVYLDGQVFGKPKDAQDAVRMLSALSGQTHEVITGVTIMTKERKKCFAVVSLVTFEKLKKAEIQYYVEHFKPFDKAGAYGIQEWIGYVGVKDIQGSYFNVMGLPVQRLYQELKKF